MGSSWRRLPQTTPWIQVSALAHGSRAHHYLLLQPPVAISMSGLRQPPPGRSHAHFADREQEPIPGISITLRILGLGSYTKIPAYGIRNAKTHESSLWILVSVLAHGSRAHHYLLTPSTSSCGDQGVVRAERQPTHG